LLNDVLLLGTAQYGFNHMLRQIKSEAFRYALLDRRRGDFWLISRTKAIGDEGNEVVDETLAALIPISVQNREADQYRFLQFAAPDSE
jgi:hypothetical protein